MEKKLIIVRGAGDLATGTIYKLKKCGFTVIALETHKPLAIRRNVAFSEAVYFGESKVEDMKCKLVSSIEEAVEVNNDGKVALMVDPECFILESVKPWALVDAILAKRNLGTTKDMAKKVIALGPGFETGVDCDIIIETMRGHNLGRLITNGKAIPNTGVPGVIGGQSAKRVIHSPANGIITHINKIGDLVKEGQVISTIDSDGEKIEVKSRLDGLLRGLIPDKIYVSKGLKIADVDPRESEINNCNTISDKARCIAGGVLEALLYLDNN